MDAARGLEMAGFIRELTLGHMEGLTENQLLTVPEGFNNNVLWNVGHVLYYLCAFTYGHSGLALPLPDEYVEWFKHGTTPSEWMTTPNSGEVAERARTIIPEIKADRAAGKFDAFEPFELAAGSSLDTLTEALVFHCAHEGMHVGHIAILKKFL